MDISYFISKRILSTQGDSFSSTIHKIAVGSIAIGLAVMILSFFILGGFQKVIREKAYSFSGHYQASKYTYNSGSTESPAVSLNSAFYQNYREYDFVSHVQEYAFKTGLLKTKEEVVGVALKGVAPSFDFERFSENMIEGRFVSFSDSTYSKEIVLSRKIADKLTLGVGDKAFLYLVQNPPRVRQLNIVGIYETGLEDFDDKVIVGDIKLVRRFNNWPDSLAGGYEIFVNDLEDEEIREKLLDLVPYDMKVEKVSEKYFQIFEWLLLLDRNVVIFLFLILFVACFNMVSIVFILIMERTQMIGLLKAIGSTSGQIRKIFLYNGVQLIFKGLIVGNAIAMGLAAIQYFFKVIPLDPKNYYMSYAPIDWNWAIVLVLNILTLVLVGTVVFVVTVVIDRVKPIKAIRFD